MQRVVFAIVCCRVLLLELLKDETYVVLGDLHTKPWCGWALIGFLPWMRAWERGIFRFKTLAEQNTCRILRSHPKGLDQRCIEDEIPFPFMNIPLMFRQLLVTVCAEIITELILERAGPVIFRTFLSELEPFRLIPVIFPVRRAKAPENDWKW